MQERGHFCHRDGGKKGQQGELFLLQWRPCSRGLVRVVPLMERSSLSGRDGYAVTTSSSEQMVRDYGQPGKEKPRLPSSQE